MLCYLRHLNASLMADKNIPTIIAQQRGGWKTDATMKKVYTHAFDQSRREADAIIDAVFEGIIGKITQGIQILSQVRVLYRPP